MSTVSFTGKKQGKASTKLGAIKTNLVSALEEQGMPGRLYIMVSTVNPSAEFRKENPEIAVLEGHPNISVKSGQILYTFGGKATVAQEDGRLQGNFFLPKDPWTVDPDTLSEFKDAKAEQAAKYSKEDQDLDEGETT